MHSLSFYWPFLGMFETACEITEGGLCSSGQIIICHHQIQGEGGDSGKKVILSGGTYVNII